MFGESKEVADKLREKIALMDQELYAYRHDREYRNQRLEEARESMNKAACDIDFEAMKVVTVWRTTTNMLEVGIMPCTALGYLGPDGKVNEFRICTSDLIHDKILVRFGEYLKRKNKRG